MTESPLLRGILHGEWGYDGLVMSDWTATRSVEGAARAALDLAMPGPASRFGPWGDALVAAVQAGRVDEALIDDKVLRILRLAARVGGLSAGQTPHEHPAAHEPRSASLDSIDIPGELRSTAAASFVLARNERSLLPLSRSGLGRVAVIGPNAEVARTLGGGSATVFPPYTVSPLEGLRGLPRDRFGNRAQRLDHCVHLALDRRSLLEAVLDRARSLDYSLGQLGDPLNAGCRESVDAPPPERPAPVTRRCPHQTARDRDQTLHNSASA